MHKCIVYRGRLGRPPKRAILKWPAVILVVILFAASNAYAQAGPILLRAGKWIGGQLIGYGAGKIIDKVAGLDCENELRQVEASLSLQIKRDTKDREKIKAELAAAQSQLQILNSLMRAKPTPVDVDQFRRQLAKDLERVLAVQEKHDERITRLEEEVARLTLQLRSLEAGPAVVRRAKELRTFNVSVAASVQWATTGILLAEGDRVAIQASGSAATVPETYSGPKGQQYRCDGTCTLPSGYYGQLVGRIGINGQPFIVGERLSMSSASSGELFLAVNDCCDWSDNEGAFAAFISVESGQ